MYRTIEKKELEARLPHRGIAFIFDEVKFKDGAFPEATTTITIHENDPRFEGHFPNSPIYPGHWQIELVCLLAAATIGLHYPYLDDFPILRVVNQVEFKRPIRPGDTITARVKLRSEDWNKNQFSFDGNITNSQRKIITKIGDIRGIVKSKV